MVLVRSRYTSINEPKKTETWLLHLNDIKSIYDINDRVIGIKFYRHASVNEHRIDLEGESVNMVASELLQLLIDHHDQNGFGEINGSVKTR